MAALANESHDIVFASTASTRFVTVRMRMGGREVINRVGLERKEIFEISRSLYHFK